MLSHLIAFAAGAAIVYLLCRASANASSSTAPVTFHVDSTPALVDTADSDSMRTPDADLDADIIEYIADNQVFHINDVCVAIAHPKGARFVRAHFHQLMEQGKIRYRNMLYTI